MMWEWLAENGMQVLGLVTFGIGLVLVSVAQYLLAKARDDLNEAHRCVDKVLELYDRLEIQLNEPDKHE